MTDTSSSKSRSGKQMLDLLQKDPKTLARDKAQAQLVDKVVEGTKVQDRERAAAEAFAQEMGMEGPTDGEGVAGTKQASADGGLFSGRASKAILPELSGTQSERVPAPNEFTIAAAPVVPRPLLGEVLRGVADPNRFPQGKIRRSRMSGDTLYASINLEGLGTSSTLLGGLHQRGQLAHCRATWRLKGGANGDDQKKEAILEDLEFIDKVIGE